MAVEYDLAGNVTSKSDVGDSDYRYSYEDGVAAQYGPHAVVDAGGRSFTYFEDGNVATDSSSGGIDRSYSYHASGKVRTISAQEGGSTSSTEFFYGPDRGRVLQILDADGEEVVTYYVGNVEKVVTLDSAEYRRSISGKALVTVDIEAEYSRTRYLHKNYLGSVIAMSDETGHVVARMSFDAWGQRRNPEFAGDSPHWVQWTGGVPAWNAQFGRLTQYTTRGFTGHEHLDDFGIVHMNGRIYDPHLARFLQADPFVEDSTTVNRYSYSHNSPMVYKDPSGYSSSSLFRTALSIAISYFTGWAVGQFFDGATAMAAAAVGGAVSGAVATGTWEGALWGAFSGLAFQSLRVAHGKANYPAGDVLGTGKSFPEIAARTLSSGIVGGVTGKVKGMKFGHGFAAAGAGALSSSYTGNALDGNDFAQTAVQAVIGGTASQLTGGKFANGAATAAFSYAVSQAGSRQGQQSGSYEDMLEMSNAEFDAWFDEHASVSFDSESAIAFELTDGMCRACFEQHRMHRAYAAGNATEADLMNLYGAQARGAMWGIGGLGGLGTKALYHGGKRLLNYALRKGSYINSGRRLRFGWGRNQGRWQIRAAGDWIRSFRPSGKIDFPIRGPKLHEKPPWKP